VGRVRLTGSAADYVALLEAGDAVNVSGRVHAEGGSFAIVVDTSADLVRAGDPGDVPREPADARALPGPAGADADTVDAHATPRLAGGLLDVGFPGELGLVGVVFASVVSVALTALRRYRTRRRLARRMAARLATFGGARAG
jgi:hypothetical protein